MQTIPKLLYFTYLCFVFHPNVIIYFILVLKGPTT